MTNTSEKMNTLISLAKADVQLVAACYPLIAEAPESEKAELLKEFILGYKTTPTTGELKLPKLISDMEEQRGMLRYGPFTDNMIKMLQKADLSEEEFYEQLWFYLQSSPLLPDTKARIIALFDCAIDQHLPYYKLDRDLALSMENAEYREVCSQIGDDVFAKMKYILDADFDQKTEQASLIVRMMDTLPDFTSRSVFMSRLISHYELRFHLMSLDRAMEVLKKDD